MMSTIQTTVQDQSVMLLYSGDQDLHSKFKQFCVYGSKITIKGQLAAYGGTNACHNRLYLYPSDDVTGPTEASIQLNPRAVFRDLTSNYASGNGGHFKIKAFAKTKAIMGRKVEEGYDPSGDGSGMGGLLGGTGTGAGPTSPWYWNLRIYNGYGASSGVPTPSANTNSYTLWMRVKIVYYVKLFNRITTVTTLNHMELLYQTSFNKMFKEKDF